MTPTTTDAKSYLHHYLQDAREALLWKLEGLSDYDVRRPLTPTGTNLLGLVKHLTGVEVGYLGFVFGRHFDEPVDWIGPDVAPNVDMWANAEQSRDDIVGLYRRTWAHSDATIEALGLDAVGHVMWWSEEQSRATLQQVLVHVIAETHRHTGHADIVRELVDGRVGLREGDDNFMPSVDQEWWKEYRDQVEHVAQAAGRRVRQ
ncbi:MAG: DUF664 domain-containing protein [Streptosporangiales bacterium]|nr:DUF664 domain-containing protein [Streptosporangiales bacterium]